MSNHDFSKRYELWLCDDCMMIHETGDATFLDYDLSERESRVRLREIEAGLRSLSRQGYFANDNTEDTERECCGCGHIGVETDFEHVAETDDDDECWVCPKCGGTDTDRREHGRDDFSWRECDCCGSRLGGSRSRYALFPNKETAGAQ